VAIGILAKLIASLIGKIASRQVTGECIAGIDDRLELRVG